MANAQKTASKSAPKASRGVPLSHGVGRRKKAVARVWLRPGSGKVRINGRASADYFDTDAMKKEVGLPFEVCPVATSFDVQANIVGGGKHGQATALKLAIARALVRHDETLRPALRSRDLLSVDARIKERKKYGQCGARRKFQFVKR